MVKKRKAFLTNTQKHKIEQFRNYLKVWKRGRKQTFPWRKNPTPYSILMAEFFLQRTRAPQAGVQYERFIRKYPTFGKLSKARAKDLKKYLIPLGLKKRVAMLKDLIKVVKKDFNGEVPADYKDLISLPGVGDYSASAVRIFALNEPAGIVDANTIRVFSRLFNKKITREEGKRSAFIKTCAEYFSSLGNPRLWNWVLLDFGNEGDLEDFFDRQKK